MPKKILIVRNARTHTMSERENDDEINEQSKQQKPNDDDANGTAAAATAISQYGESQGQSAIFKLTAICFDDLFDCLSLRDLHSLGQTCKRMYRFTGLYFQDNIKHTFDCDYQNLFYEMKRFDCDYQQLFDGFPQYVKSIKFIRNNRENFQYVDTNCDSVREFSFIGDFFENCQSLIDCIKAKLSQVESIHFHLTRKPFLFYNDFLKLCPNLTRLCIKDQDPIEIEWTCHKYPKLEHLRLEYPKQRVCPYLQHFFEQNSHLQRFETDHFFLWSNRDTFINTKLKLNVLHIRFGGVVNEDLKDICMLLDWLQENGFFKRLEIGYFGYGRMGFSSMRPDFSQIVHRAPTEPIQIQFNRIGTMHGLEQLYGKFDANLSLPPMINLQQLYILNDGLDDIDLNSYTVACPNLRQIYLKNASINNVLPFIQRLPILKEIVVRHLIIANESHIDLYALNEERDMLAGACKLFIYVQEDIYLESKMAAKNVYVNHDLIEIKRFESNNMLCSDERFRIPRFYNY